MMLDNGPYLAMRGVQSADVMRRFSNADNNAYVVLGQIRACPLSLMPGFEENQRGRHAGSLTITRFGTEHLNKTPRSTETSTWVNSWTGPRASAWVSVDDSIQAILDQISDHLPT